ncbi:RNA-directed DNA polymerase [Chitinibacter tainanensis]|uniref:RNA-directed DNA polymerase n=1 Tax=Chitinibacter tainanensis TaxID=230667 RepID=UPI0003F69FAE|nr:RNA-directed DNA polymerase [Chitinibacter tainanensis]
MKSPITKHREATYELARSLAKSDIHHWLIDHGYFPENYVLPPCFAVIERPKKPTVYYKKKKKGKEFKVDRTECVNVHFPKSEFTDRTFGIIHPKIYNDISYHISRNWLKIVDAMIPKDSQVTSYSFPIPIDSRTPGRLGYLRSGRMIYEFISMTDTDISSVAYKYAYMVKADIKNFYPSIYTHSIAWALHGKSFIRKPVNLHNYNHLGNRLDRLFQNANDGCTNGIPIGPVVSDVISEVIASAVDVLLTKLLKSESVEYEAVRFKDDYRILVKSEADAKIVIKSLQAALKEFNLELNDEKTKISALPDGLFREWVSKYHAAYPKKLENLTWKQFRELYLSVIAIDKIHPGTGVIDRFLADITDKEGQLKIWIGDYNIEKVISMLLMLATLRVKAFPKVMAILEGVLNSLFGSTHKEKITEYLEMYLLRLSKEEERHKYLISWISYFLVSNDLVKHLSSKPKFKDQITRSIFNNRGAIFKDCKEYKLFVGCKTISKKISMYEHLDVFDPPQIA